jgi:hypothetical protein
MNFRLPQRGGVEERRERESEEGGERVGEFHGDEWKVGEPRLVERHALEARVRYASAHDLSSRKAMAGLAA